MAALWEHALLGAYGMHTQRCEILSRSSNRRERSPVGSRRVVRLLRLVLLWWDGGPTCSDWCIAWRRLLVLPLPLLLVLPLPLLLRMLVMLLVTPPALRIGHSSSTALAQQGAPPWVCLCALRAGLVSRLGVAPCHGTTFFASVRHLPSTGPLMFEVGFVSPKSGSD